MFDLESSIAQWRQQMLTAGIPLTTLDELESHLRDEIERQMLTGLSEQEAFVFAAQKIGQPIPLTAEFKKTTRFGELVRVDYALALGWLIYCTGSFLSHGVHLWRNTSISNFHVLPQIGLFALDMLLEFIYLRGAIACLLLFKGVSREQYILWLIAILDLVGTAAFAIIRSGHLPAKTICFAILSLISIWWFRPTHHRTIAAK